MRKLKYLTINLNKLKRLINTETGIDKWTIIRIYPIVEDKELIRYIVIISDQTKILKNEQILSDALVSAQSANNTRKDFLSLMSHEIRTQ